MLDAEMALSDYDFDFPEGAVARSPADPRDCARLLVLDRAKDRLEHARFSELGRWLSPGDCVVLNTTRVLPARLKARKPTGGKAELLLVRPLGPGRWSALSSRLRKGQELLLPGGFRTRVLGLSPEGEYLLSFEPPDTAPLLRDHGLAPLPPYILKARDEADKDDRADIERYQTVFAAQEGSIAAPTAGLHFTPGLLAALKRKGVRVAELVLHVGPGTFRPILGPEIASHRMLPERYELDAEAAGLVRAARLEGRRVVAVGTTCTRVLETLAAAAGTSPFAAGAGETSLFIHPGHRFLCVDALITNFHLPKSTPLLLACAFAGRERILAAYREAVARDYRLFSYGDAMLIV